MNRLFIKSYYYKNKDLLRGKYGKKNVVQNSNQSKGKSCANANIVQTDFMVIQFSIKICRILLKSTLKIAQKE